MSSSPTVTSVMTTRSTRPAASWRSWTRPARSPPNYWRASPSSTTRPRDSLRLRQPSLSNTATRSSIGTAGDPSSPQVCRTKSMIACLVGPSRHVEGILGHGGSSWSPRLRARSRAANDRHRLAGRCVDRLRAEGVRSARSLADVASHHVGVGQPPVPLTVVPSGGAAAASGCRRLLDGVPRIVRELEAGDSGTWVWASAAGVGFPHLVVADTGVERRVQPGRGAYLPCHAMPAVPACAVACCASPRWREVWMAVRPSVCGVGYMAPLRCACSLPRFGCRPRSRRVESRGGSAWRRFGAPRR